ncbi:MAG: GNAT family N-acetyltransferase [Oscillochloris sp.]|nr:GNAT family N-acetyltransferase [Oscillochloris sp.]
MSTQIVVQPVLPEAYRSAAGALIYHAFQRKLQPLVGDPVRGPRILAAGLNLDRVLGAFDGDELVGVAGLEYAGRRVFAIKPRHCIAEFGWWRGLYTWAAINQFTLGFYPPGQIHIAALAVNGRRRGQGIGSILLEAVFDLARHQNLRAVRLEVVDTNQGAQQLYERFGFTVIHRFPLPFLRNWLGFSAVNEMIKKLAR